MAPLQSQTRREASNPDSSSCWIGKQHVVALRELPKESGLNKSAQVAVTANCFLEGRRVTLAAVCTLSSEAVNVSRGRVPGEVPCLRLCGSTVC